MPSSHPIVCAVLTFCRTNSKRISFRRVSAETRFYGRSYVFKSASPPRCTTQCRCSTLFSTFITPNHSADYELNRFSTNQSGTEISKSDFTTAVSNSDEQGFKYLLLNKGGKIELYSRKNV